jgi:hypothetical protein
MHPEFWRRRQREMPRSRVRAHRDAHRARSTQAQMGPSRRSRRMRRTARARKRPCRRRAARVRSFRPINSPFARTIFPLLRPCGAADRSAPTPCRVPASGGNRPQRKRVSEIHARRVKAVLRTTLRLCWRRQASRAALRQRSMCADDIPKTGNRVPRTRECTRFTDGTSLVACPNAMRKRYRVLMLSAVVALLAVPFGFALSLESDRPTRAAVTAARPDFAWPMAPEGAELAVAGGLLFGAAALVRRAG